MRARTKHTKATENDTNDDKFIIVNLHTFSKFQERIYHVVHSIVCKGTTKQNKFCTEWIQAEKHPLHVFDEKATFRTIQKLFKIKNLKEYRELLLNCPDISKYVTTRERDTVDNTFEFKCRFHHNNSDPKIAKRENKDSMQPKITYVQAALKEPTKMPSDAPTLAITTEENAIDLNGYHSCLETTEDFGHLMNQVWQIMHSYAVAVPDDDVSIVWTKWQEQGLKSTSTFQDVKRITSIDTLDEFYLYLSDCSPITTVLDLKWDHKILYRVPALDTPAPSMPTSEITDSDATMLPESDSKPTPVPSSTTVPVTPVKHQSANESSSSDSFTAVDLDVDDYMHPSFYVIGLHDIQTSSQFIVFQAAVFDTIQAWATAPNTRNHPFHTKWKKALFTGMDRYKNFNQVRKILKIEKLFEYLEFVSQCPDVKQTYEWKWTPDELRYWYTDIPLNVDLNKVENLRHDLTNFQVEYAANLTDLRNRMRDAHFNLEVVESRIKAQANKLESKFKHHIMAETESIKPIIANHLLEAETKLKAVSDTSINTFQLKMKSDLFMQEAKLTEYTSKFTSSIKHLFESSMETASTQLSDMKSNLADHARNIHSDFSKKADKFTASIQQISTQALENLKHSTLQAPKNQPNLKVKTAATMDIRSPTAESSFIPHADMKPVTSNPTMTETTVEPPTFKASTRWTNVDPAFIQKLEEFTPGSKSSLPSATMPYNQFGYNQEEGQLPPLLYDMVMKRTSVQYTGQGEILVFYNQLMNGLSPYGCYLKKIVDIQVDETLCPAQWEGIPITDARYLQMAGCIYQKLASVDVIPMEYTHARNIINRFAEANDGYKALYALLEPLLNRETISEIPTIRTCSDIHEYSLKVQSYFNCKLLAGRAYRQREQVNTFLTGLAGDAQYHPAIRRARTLLDTTNRKDPTVPAPLKLSALPNTIDRYLTEETGQPVIRAVYHTEGRQRQDENRHNRSNEKCTPRLESTKPCGTCLMHGHTSSTCYPFAKFLLHREAEKTADAVAKTKLIGAYKAELRRKHELRFKRQQLGTIRQMWQAGSTYEDIESSLLATLPEFQDAAEYHSETDNSYADE